MSGLSGPLQRSTAAIVVLCAATQWFVQASVSAQALTHRGFVDARTVLFPQEASNDQTQVMSDLLVREEVFVKAAPWIQFAGGLEARANTHGQVEPSWTVDVRDRGVRRPAISLRRLTATVTKGPLTVDAGKQFIRWGKADIVTPTDHFAPRDFLNVVDSDFIAVTGARAGVQSGTQTLDVVWVPSLTPSRTPLLDQRWTVVPPTPEPVTLVDAGALFPRGTQAGVRWGRNDGRFEYSASYFDGYNHLPTFGAEPGSTPAELRLIRTYPRLRSYGADGAVPAPWFTIKGEAAYSTSPEATADEYVIYVIQLERQAGEWTFVGGYAGEAVTVRRALLSFAPDRGLTRAFIARASHTIDVNRSAAFETAIRQNVRGAYFKGEYSQARGQHWRATVVGTLIRGDVDDFIGQYRRNSNVTMSLRYSF